MFLIKLILYFFLFIFLLGIIGALLLRRSVQKVKRQFEDQMNYSEDQRSGYKEGDVHINMQSKEKPDTYSKTDGEYIDFEEVEE